MLHFYHAGGLETLFEALTDYMEAHPPAHVLEPVVLLVPNRDTGRWVQVHTARKKGISANIQTILPAQLVHQLNLQRDSGYEDSLPDKEELTWRVYRELIERPDDPGLGLLHEYARNDELRRYQLAGKIADIYDQYMLFRPDLIQNWNQGRLDLKIDNPHQNWQALLWGYIKEQEPKPTDRATLHELLIRYLLSDDCKLPGRMCVFAAGSIPPVYIEVLETLANKTEVHWFRVFPYKNTSGVHFAPGKGDACRHPEIRVHPLLQSFAGEYAGLESVIQMICRKSQKITHNLFEREAEKKPGSLLQKLQSEIRGTIDSDSGDFKPDTSIQVHACHNTLREVEVVQDQILDFLQQNPDAGPGDILITSPDIGKFAGQIEAVFGSPGREDVRLPFRVNNAASSPESRLYTVIRQILDIHKKRFKAGAVISIIDSGPVSGKFELSPDDITLIEHWVTETGIRWGFDADYRGDDGIYSWKFGLERLIAGTMVPVDFEEELLGTYPYADMEGSDAVGLAGKLHRICRLLKDWVEFSRKPHRPAGWADKISELISAFIPENRAYEKALLTFEEALERIRGAGRFIPDEPGLSLDMVLETLDSGIRDAIAGSSYRSGVITCSPMVPVRHIPYRFIAILGLDEAEFPGNDIKNSFDLMASHPRTGDRSIRLSNRALFLDALLAAGDRIHLSYTGFNIRDGSEIPPSRAVGELLEYLGDKMGSDDPEALVYKHRLHAFHPAYFTGDSLFTYQKHRRLQAGNVSILNDKTGLPERMDAPVPKYEKPVTISQREVSLFLERPYKWLMENRLNMRRVPEEAPLSDRDPMLSRYLEIWKLDQKIFEAVKENQTDAEALYRKLHLMGLTAYGEPGKLEFQERFEIMLEIWKRIPEKLKKDMVNRYEQTEIEFEINGETVVLQGGIPENAGSTVVFAEAAKLKPVRKIRVWLQHLFMNAHGSSVTTKYIGLVEKGNSVQLLTFQPPKNAREILAGIAEMMFTLDNAPVPGYPEVTSVVIELIGKPDQEIASHNKFRKLFDPEPFYPHQTIQSKDDYAGYFIQDEVNQMDVALIREFTMKTWLHLNECMEEEEI